MVKRVPRRATTRGLFVSAVCAMTSDADMLQKIQVAFAKCHRPEHFTDYWHCEECAEHDALLRSRDIHTLRLKDIGNVGWDPICYISPEGFAYYLPALARFALDEPDPDCGWYVGSLLWHLSFHGRRSERWLACTPEQRRIVLSLLHHIAETRSALVESYNCSDELREAIEIWSDEAPSS